MFPGTPETRDPFIVHDVWTGGVSAKDFALSDPSIAFLGVEACGLFGIRLL